MKEVINTVLNVIELIAIVLVFLVVISVIPGKTKATAPECKCPCCIAQVQKAPELKKEAKKEEVKKGEAKQIEKKAEKKVEKKDAKIQQSKGIDPRYDHKPGMAPAKKQDKAAETAKK